MNRAISFSTTLLVAISIAANWTFAAPHGGGGGHGGGGSHGGGGGGVHMGGSGMRMGGGGGLSAGSAFRSGGGIHMSPGISSGPRFSPSLGSGMRLSPSLGSGIRVSPGTSALRSAPSLSRIPSMGGLNGLNLSRQGSTALRPSINSSLGSRILSTPGTNGRSTLGGLGQSGLRLGNTNLSSSNRAALGLQSRGPSSLVANAGGFQRGNGSLQLPFAGRVTPSQLGNFLSLSNRGGLNASGQLRGAQALNISHLGGQSNWRNLQGSQLNRINNNVNVAFRSNNSLGLNHLHNGFGYGFNNNNYWNNWAGGVRGFGNFNHFHNCFTPRFWATNYVSFPWYRSYYWWGARPWSYWWGCPTWGGLTSWFPSYGWNSPYYYGYGPGGNIIYQNGYVYMNDQPIATAEDYAASAAALADVPAPANPNQATDWMPLGTFALSEGENDTNPSRVVQLAVDKDGNVSGTMTNQKTNQTLPIQGRVDKDTQRVAFTIGDNKDVVVETGIYNLTQQQTPVLAHGEGREETYLLLRLDPPKADDAKGATTPSTSGKTLVP